LIKDKVVVVTGGLGLLGKEICKAVVENHGIVVIADVQPEKGKNFEEELNNLYGQRTLYTDMDITKKESIQNAINLVKKEYGKIDAVINNAYPRNKNYGRHLFDVSYEDFCENVNLHLGGYFLIMQQFSEYFISQGYGNIINMSSVYGVIAPRFEIYEGTNMTMPVEYAAIKSAVIHLTKYFAKYLKGKNIRVNSISPGGIFDYQNPVFVKNYEQKVPLKRMGKPDDIAPAVSFLLSDESKYITGHNLIVDGGWTAI